MSESLTEYWKRFKPKSGRLNVHPDDLAWFETNQPNGLEPGVQTFDGFVKGKRFGSEADKFHMSLLPSPFHGNLTNAKILILLMNPGFIPSDYYADQDRAFRTACISNLRQTNGKSQFPFFGLNPKFAWSGAYQWAERRLRPIVQRLQKHHDCTYYKALAIMSKQIAIIELIPYHSSGGNAFAGWGNAWRDLPSAIEARNYVKGLCKSPRKTLIILARSHEKWGIPDAGNVVRCPPLRGVTFNPDLTTESGKAGRRIIEKLGLPL